MMKDEIFKELDVVLGEKTVAFFSATMTRKEDADIHATFSVFGIDQATYETRLLLSDALIDLAQRMRQRE